MINFTYEPETFEHNGEEYLNEFITYNVAKDAGTEKAEQFLCECINRGVERAKLERLTGNKQCFGEYELFCLGVRSLANR
jgi:hypothetical protein